MDNVPGVTRNPCFLWVLSLMKRAIPRKTKMNQEEDFVSIGDHFPSMCGRPETSSPPRNFTVCPAGSWWHPLDYWQDRVWRPPCSKERFGSWARWYSKWCLPVCRCLGSQFLFNAYRALLEGGTVPEHFAESRTVFFAELSLSPELWHRWQWKDYSISRCTSSRDFVQLRLQASYFCHLSIPSLVHHEMHTSFTEMHQLQKMTDNIFEIETTALAHVACAPQESGILLTDFGAAYPVSATPGSSLCSRTRGCPVFAAASCGVFTAIAPRTWNSPEQTEDNSLWPEVYDRVVQRVVSFLRWLLTLSSDGSKRLLSQGTLTTSTSYSLPKVLTLTTSL